MNLRERRSSPVFRRLVGRGLLAWFCGCALFSAPLAAQQAQSAAAAPASLTLHVQFCLTKGRFAVERAMSHIVEDEATFRARYKRPRKEVEARLLDILDDVLAGGEKALTM